MPTELGKRISLAEAGLWLGDGDSTIEGDALMKIWKAPARSEQRSSHLPSFLVALQSASPVSVASLPYLNETGKYTHANTFK